MWKLPINVEEGTKHLLPRDVVKNKNLQDVTVEQKPDVLSSIQGLRKLVEADYVCICFVTKHHYTELPWFSFSLFYILLFSVHIVNVNAAKSSTVFITCP